MENRIQVKGELLEVSTHLWITAQTDISIRPTGPPSVFVPHVSHLAVLPAELFHIQSGQASGFGPVTHKDDGIAACFGLKKAMLDADILQLQFPVPIPAISPTSLFSTTDMTLTLCVSSCGHLCCWKLGSEVNWGSWGLTDCCQSQLYMSGTNGTIVDCPFHS